jgi:hypothetical protein
VKLYQLRLHNIVQKEKEVEAAAAKLVQEASTTITSNINRVGSVFMKGQES